jgi:hypothetical protein
VPNPFGEGVLVPVKILIYGQIASVNNGKWSCTDDSLTAMLEALTDIHEIDKLDDKAHALYAAGRLGGLLATEQGWQNVPYPEAKSSCTTKTARMPTLTSWLGYIRQNRTL